LAFDLLKSEYFLGAGRGGSLASERLANVQTSATAEHSRAEIVGTWLAEQWEQTRFATGILICA